MARVIILLVTVTFCVCVSYAKSVPQICQSGVCVRWDRDASGKYVEIHTEKTTTRIYEDGRALESMTKKQFLKNTDSKPEEWGDGPYWTRIDLKSHRR